MIRFDTAGGSFAIENEKIWDRMKYYNQLGQNMNNNSKKAFEMQKMFLNLKHLIFSICNTNEKQYTLIITSCASESNNFVFRGISDYYNFYKKIKPLYAINRIEHDTTIDCIDILYNKLKIIKLKMIPIDKATGIININDLKTICSKDKPKLLSIMTINNELGCVNPLNKIYKECCKPNKILLHSDCTQSFGKFPINLTNTPIDFITFSMNKIENGILGIGFLLCKRILIPMLIPQIAGHNSINEFGLRGGTPSPMLLAGSYYALIENFKDREKKNKHINELKEYFIDKLLNTYTDSFFLEDYKSKNGNSSINDYVKNNNSTKPYFIILTPKNSIFTHILTISMIYNQKLCNIKLKKFLELEADIYISIGSLCKTQDKKSSYVIEALGINNSSIKRGIHRISFYEKNTKKEIDKLFNYYKIFLKLIKT